MKFVAVFKRVLSKYLLIWLVLACFLGFFWNDLMGFDKVNPFVLTANGTAILISVTMLAVGSLLPYEEVKEVAKRWPKVLGGTCIQYISMPTIAFCVAKAFHLEGPYFIGVMMAGCVPGAMASNVLTMTARGNVSYSVGLTTSATLLSPFVVPATLYLFFHSAKIHIDSADVMRNLLMTVVAPVAIGFACARFWRWWRFLAENFAEIAANFAIIWIISGVVAKNAEKLVSMSATLIIAMLILNIGGYLCGYFGGMLLRITPTMRRALTIEIGMQNAGLGVALCMKYFGEMEEASLFCAAYSFECMATGIVLAQIFRYISSRKERLEGAQTDSAKPVETAE